MNVLIITKAPWDDRIASGNTLSNLFGGWSDVNFYCLYSRDSRPSNKVCRNYFSISPTSIFKNFFHPYRIGKRFTTLQCETVETLTSYEEVLIGKAKRNKRLFKLIYYLAYASNLWINDSFKSFIEESSPDVVFCFGQTDPLTYKAVRYIKTNTRARIISYYVDDLYKPNVTWISLLKKIDNIHLRSIASMSDKCYAISEMMCEEYRTLYNKPFTLLHKGCDVYQPKSCVSNPIRFVYAGNLYYKRDQVLVAIASAIDRINDGIPKAHLDIYSGTPVSNEKAAMLNIHGASALHPACPYNEIKRLMREADIVLHVESFDETQIQLVRLSFSTKITDCMQSGSMMMAIGPMSVASISYANNVPGCVVVNDLKKIDAAILSLVNSKSTILKNAEKTNNFAKDNIIIDKIQKRLRNDFNSLLG